jgi:hypothetical protein
MMVMEKNLSHSMHFSSVSTVKSIFVPLETESLKACKIESEAVLLGYGSRVGVNQFKLSTRTDFLVDLETWEGGPLLKGTMVEGQEEMPKEEKRKMRERDKMLKLDRKKKKVEMYCNIYRNSPKNNVSKMVHMMGCNLFAIMCSTKCMEAKCQQKYGAQQ